MRSVPFQTRRSRLFLVLAGIALFGASLLLAHRLLYHKLLEEAMEKFANPHRTLQNVVNARNDAERKCMEDMNDLRFRLSNDIEAAQWGKRLARCIRELDGLDTASTTTDVVFDD